MEEDNYEFLYLNTQIFSLGDIFILVLAAFAFHGFDFDKFIRVFDWSPIEMFLFIAPLAAQILQAFFLVVGDWLYKFDFGAEIEELVFGTILMTFLLTQFSGNIFNFAGGALVLIFVAPVLVLATIDLPMTLMLGSVWGPILALVAAGITAGGFTIWYWPAIASFFNTTIIKILDAIGDVLDSILGFFVGIAEGIAEAANWLHANVYELTVGVLAIAGPILIIILTAIQFALFIFIGELMRHHSPILHATVLAFYNVALRLIFSLIFQGSEDDEDEKNQWYYSIWTESIYTLEIVKDLMVSTGILVLPGAIILQVAEALDKDGATDVQLTVGRASAMSLDIDTSFWTEWTSSLEWWQLAVVFGVLPLVQLVKFLEEIYFYIQLNSQKDASGF